LKMIYLIFRCALAVDVKTIEPKFDNSSNH
jgi:hypothetical protein